MPVSSCSCSISCSPLVFLQFNRKTEHAQIYYLVWLFFTTQVHIKGCQAWNKRVGREWLIKLIGLKINVIKGQVSKETVVLRRWGVLQDNLVLSTELIMWIGHRKEIQKLTFRQSDSLRWRANTWNFSFRISLRWPIHIINSVDKTKLSPKMLYSVCKIFWYLLQRENLALEYLFNRRKHFVPWVHEDWGGICHLATLHFSMKLTLLFQCLKLKKYPSCRYSKCRTTYCQYGIILYNLLLSYRFSPKIMPQLIKSRQRVYKWFEDL